VGGDPAPHSCANEIIVVNRATGRLRTYLRTGNDILISGAVPNPDGHLLAYSESGCTNAGFSTHLRISNLTTGSSWTIGARLAGCYLLSGPAWSTDGRSLLVAYGSPKDMCGGIGAERLVELPLRPQAGLTGRAVEPAKGCDIRSAASVAGGGAVAFEACGLHGPARLLVLYHAFDVVRRLPLGRCSDGNALASDFAGRDVLVSAYLFCNPPGHPGPVTRLWTFDGSALHAVTKVPGGVLAFSQMTW
jgi:hypothetical protein